MMDMKIEKIVPPDGIVLQGLHDRFLRKDTVTMVGVYFLSAADSHCSFNHGLALVGTLAKIIHKAND